jgi:ubiquinone/menaquinone biosynthesis C-methylase UbiE
MQNTARDAHFWDRIARRYATDPIKDLPGYERTVERTGQLLRPNDHVLELGCGTGTTALKLAPKVKHILGTDISGEMIAIAQERTADERCPNAEFAAVTADSLAGSEEKFDAVLAFNLLHLVSERPVFLRQVYGLLKPRGLFVSKTPCLSEMNPLIRLAVPAMQLVGKAPTVAFFKAPTLETEIERAGFAITEADRHGSQPKDARIFIVARKPEAFAAGVAAPPLNTAAMHP